MRIFYISIILILLVTNAIAFRVGRPATFSLPWTQDQINQLNDALASLWNVSLGNYTMDVVTTSKLRANNGDMWILQTGIISQVQWRANDRTYTVRGN